MSSCLKCGREIPEGQKICKECGLAGQKQVEEYLALMEQIRWKRKKRPDGRFVVIILTGVIAVLFVIAIVFLLSLFSNEEFMAKAQSSICRRNMSRIMDAINEYYEVNNSYPPAGTLNPSHILIRDDYLNEALRCPATKHYYVLVKKEGKLTVICDSKLPEHKLE
ncbi:MAG: hypothetical protein PHP64_08155 [Actinomycetota bacterium]|nr:hypothetical protein [Actinomycetota bacterium]